MFLKQLSANMNMIPKQFVSIILITSRINTKPWQTVQLKSILAWKNMANLLGAISAAIFGNVLKSYVVSLKN